MGYKANITSNLANQIIRIIVGALTGIVVARVLGPAGQGYVAYMVVIFTLLGDYGHLGLNNAVMYFKKRSTFEPKHIFNVNVTTLLLLWLIISSVVLLLRNSGLVLSGYNYIYIIGGLLFVICDFVFTSHHSWMIGDERIVESNRYIISAFFLKSIAILMLWIFKLLTPLTFFGVTVISMLLNAMFLQFRLPNPRPAIDIALLKAEYSFGGIIWLGAVFSFLHYRVDQIMIKQLLGISELGIYSVAVSLAELMFLIPLSINSALLGKLYNTDDRKRSRLVMSQTVKLSLFVCIGLAALGIPLCLLIPVFYGAAYSGAVLSTMILLLGVIFASLAKVSAPYFFSQGRPGVHLFSTFAALLLNFGLNLLLIPMYGITGAAIASTTSYFIYGLFYLGLFIFREKFTFRELFLLQAADIQDLWKRK